MEIKPIATIYTDFPEKFGIPRQAGIVPELTARIVLKPEYSQPEAVKGLEGFDYIWVIWDFSLAHSERFAASVCPPRLGGKETAGVFASRSPFRPNSLGLSSLRLLSVEHTEKGTELLVSGADMVSGTPVYDIKPYITFEDSHPEAKSGYVDTVQWEELTVLDPGGLIAGSDLSEKQKTALRKILGQDPRSRFDLHSDGTRRYGFYFSHYDVRFTVSGRELSVVELAEGKKPCEP